MNDIERRMDELEKAIERKVARIAKHREDMKKAPDILDKDWFQEYVDASEALRDIWKICHVPSSEHPKGSHAETHFMADFDQIRAICKPFIEEK